MDVPGVVWDPFPFRKDIENVISNGRQFSSDATNEVIDKITVGIWKAFSESEKRYQEEVMKERGKEERMKREDSKKRKEREDLERETQRKYEEEMMKKAFQGQ